MSDIHEDAIKMTPQISPKDIPQNMNESDSEEEPVYNNIVQESSSSDEDDEIDTPQGYVPLSMNDGSETSEDFLQESEEDNSVTESHENNEPQVNEIINDTVCPPASHNDNTKELTMDGDQVNLIQQVMSRISLPSSSVPEWANLIPEDKWKTSLLTSLENRTHSPSSTKWNTTDPDK